MPRVRAPQQTVLSRPLSTPSPVRRDVSSGTEALSRAVGQVSNIAQEAFETQRRARLQEAFTDLGKTRQDIVSTARQQHGRDALETDLVAQTEQLLDQAAETLAEGLPDDLREDFAQIRRQHALGLRDSIVDHVDREAAAYGLQQYQGSLALAQDMGAKGAVASRPGSGAAAPELAEARQTVLNAVGSRTRSWAPEAAAAERTAQLTALHVGVVEALGRQGRAAEAFAYLSAVRGEMDAGKAAEFEKAILGPAQVGQALAIVQDLEARFPDPEERTKQVLALQGPLADKVLQVHKEREAAREEVEKDVAKARFGRVADAIEKGEVKTQSQLEGLLDFSRLSDEDRPRARKYLEDNKRAERTLVAAERAAQAQVDDSLRKDFEARSPEERATMDVRATYGGRASKDGLNVIRKGQQAAAKEWNKDQGVSEGEFKRFVGDQVRGVLTKKEDLADFHAAMGRVRQAWLEEPANAGKEPGRELVKKWIVEQLQIGDAAPGGSWLSPDRPRFRHPRNQAFYPGPEDVQTFTRKLGAAAAEPPPAAPAAPAPAAAAPLTEDDRARVLARWPRGARSPTDDQIRAVLERERSLSGGPR